MSRLVVVSNRVAKPDGGKGSEGGLAVGVMAAMEATGGLWFGWNGKVSNTPDERTEIERRGQIEYATVSLKKADYTHYYKGYANSVLWPLFHQRPDLMRYAQADFLGYHAVNERFARELTPLLRPSDVIWVHDYHLIPLGKVLRRMGVKNRIGFFLHTPFPPLDLVRAVPEHRELLIELLHYDLIGFQTETDLRGFRESIRYSLQGEAPERGPFRFGELYTRAGVYPIGIETDLLPGLVERGKQSTEYELMKGNLADRTLIIGVDRLDYSKGLEHRFLAYEKLLQNHRELHRKLVYLQIAPVSRGDVQAYGDFANKIDRTAGHIIGTWAGFDWVPLRYLNRGYRRATILAMYNLARVGFVTPLRDGMNLVAKEYVMAQNPEDPGVLVLSKMAGAAAELDAAVIVNPYNLDSVAKWLATAVSMPLDERVDRWRRMAAVLKRNNIHAWHRRFLQDLTGRDQPAPAAFADAHAL